MIYSAEELMAAEDKRLASYAVKSLHSLGRKHAQSPENERLPFQKDSERIIHSKAFRRLDQKTQVLMAGSGDHYRTRLTHTLEVSKVSRDIARRLGLNEDLCEAIALAHDLGHPPFGHSGEEALNEVMQDFGKHFEHNEQSRLIVEKLEKAYPDFDGLNLTLETLDGLIKHQSAYDQADLNWEVSAHLEAQIVNIADEIAYTNHDMDDGLRSGFIGLDELRELKLWQMGEELALGKYKDLKGGVLVSRVISSIMSLMINDLCRETEGNLQRLRINSVEDVRNHPEMLASFSKEMREELGEMRKFLFDNFYMHPQISESVRKGKMMLKKVFKYYYEQEADEEKAKNYVAGMTDRFLIEEFERLGL